MINVSRSWDTATQASKYYIGICVVFKLIQRVTEHMGWADSEHYDWQPCSPDAKHPVQEEAAQEAQHHVGPRVPGIQLHEPGSI